jgi:hypothetical protein
LFFEQIEAMVKIKIWHCVLFNQYFGIFSNYLYLSKRYYSLSVLNSLKAKLKILIYMFLKIRLKQMSQTVGMHAS